MAISTSSIRTARTSLRLPALRTAFCLVLLMSCFASGALARRSETRHLRIHRVAPASQAETTVIPPRPRSTASPGVQLRMRAESKDGDATSTESSHHTKTSSKTSTKTTHKSETTDDATASVTTLTISVSRATSTADVTTSALPQAFDGNLDAEFDDSDSSSNCPTFLDSVLKDPSYEACYPLSLMLQTSQGFFNAQKQLLSIVRVLDATCAANVTYCTEFFDAAAKNLTSSANCKQEWNDGDTTVKEFLYGLQAYEMMYQATCLQDPDSDMYCYASAVTNTTTASNAYFYYLPYNLTLPASTNPSCNWCIEETMAIFHSAAADRSQPISNTYEAAARQVNTICGLDFVNSTLPKEEVSAGSGFLPSWTALLFSLVGAVLINGLL